MPLSDHRDTACPYTKLPKSKRLERYPDIIAIGMPKCGTGKNFHYQYSIM